MTPAEIAPNVLSWASELDDVTRTQAAVTGRLPILAGPLALMPDAHLGMGATIGSVIPTESAVIPSAVGVDIGCGMAARRLRLTVDQLPDAGLGGWVDATAKMIPAGLGQWHGEATTEGTDWLKLNPPPPTLEKPQRAAMQLGTLGSGNHFVEIASDQTDRVWVLLHSGSRGAGNKLATLHTRTAKRLHEGLGTALEDPELAWLQSGTTEFADYLRDLLWSQAYAMENRRQLLESATLALRVALGRELSVSRDVNCHHNYTAHEQHGGRLLWITRKGAIRARVGDWGLIPGSMGQKSYVVEGLGNPLSYNSCSHGAGRRMSRRQARRELTTESLTALMGTAAWQDSSVDDLLDEHPHSYKDIDQVMRDQADLVQIKYELQALANYKGVEDVRK